MIPQRKDKTPYEPTAEQVSWLKVGGGFKHAQKHQYCNFCQKEYWTHPDVKGFTGLVMLCTGDIVKL